MMRLMMTKSPKLVTKLMMLLLTMILMSMKNFELKLW